MSYLRLRDIREAYTGYPAFIVDEWSRHRTVIRCWRTLEPYITITYH